MRVHKATYVNSHITYACYTRQQFILIHDLQGSRVLFILTPDHSFSGESLLQGAYRLMQGDVKLRAYRDNKYNTDPAEGPAWENLLKVIKIWLAQP